MFGTSFSIFTLAVNPRRVRSPTMIGATAWYDPADLSTLFQDAAMTIPVTSDGDQVGAMLDKSGNGYHFFQSADSTKPVYRTDGTLHWIESDGVDDIMIGTHRFGLGTNPALTVTGGFRFGSMDQGIAMAIGDEANVGLLAPGIGSNGMTWRHGNGYSAFGFISTGDNTVLSWHRPAGTTYAAEKFARNGVDMPLVSSGNGTGVPTNTGVKTSLFSQANAALNLAFRLYALVVLTSDDATEKAYAEAWVAGRSGVSL